MILDNTYDEKSLISLKKQYNRMLKRNKNAEEFFRTKSVAECLRYLNLFNEITQELSRIIFIVEYITGEEIDYYTKINGFKEVWNEGDK